MIDVNPSTSPYGGAWGNCAPFSVAVSPQQIVQPVADEPEPQCGDGKVLNKRGVCIPDLQCKAPAQSNSTGTACICPDQSIAGPKGCAPDKPDPISCNALAVPNKASTACICPEGTVAQGKRCVEVDEQADEALQCRAPAVPNRRGTACVCPKGMIADGNRCLEPEINIELPDIELPKLDFPDGGDKPRP